MAEPPRLPLFEVCIDSVEGARVAEAAGANRLELCANLVQGGTTPSLGMIEAVRAAVQLPVMVMVRPRGGDFCYSADELGVMLRDAARALDAGADGIVTGALTPDGHIDMASCRRLVDGAAGCSITFHRAFDWTVDADLALENLIELRIDRVLTSGLQPTAEQGAPRIRALVEAAADRIAIMAGSGVRAENVRYVLQQTGVRELHLSGSQPVGSPVTYRPAVPMYQLDPLDDFHRAATSRTILQQVFAAAARRDDV